MCGSCCGFYRSNTPSVTRSLHVPAPQMSCSSSQFGIRDGFLNPDTDLVVKGDVPAGVTLSFVVLLIPRFKCISQQREPLSYAVAHTYMCVCIYICYIAYR